MKPYKFISRLIVGIALILLAGVLIWNVIRTVAFPRLPLKKGSEYVQDISGSMSEPDKTYARNAIEEAARKYKIAIVLDYELTTFEINESYIDKEVGVIVNNVYRNQPYIVYTYFKDTQTFVITTNINNEAKRVVSQKKEGIDSDSRVVKEILYFQQNLEKGMGIRNWNFNLNTESSRNVVLSSIGSILLLVLGIGVFPSESFKLPKLRRKKVTHSEG